MIRLGRIDFRGCVALAAALLAGCGGGIPDVEEATAQGVLLKGNGSEPKTLDPQVATGVTENKIISSLIEGLIAYHPTDDELPEPGVAERWEPNEDYSEWTFFLREDALWSNGDPVTAHDFVWSYERMLTPEFGAEYVEMLYSMENAEEFHRGELTDFSAVGVEALDERTLRIRLVGPTPFFLGMLKHYAWYPVHPPTVEAYGTGRLDRSSPWTLQGRFVGNGPFVLEEWRVNQYIRVTKSPTYWDRDRVRLNEIYFMAIEDVNTEQRMYASGRLHVTNTVPSNDISNLRRTRPDELRLEPYLGTYFYRFNTTRPPFDDARVRRALAMSMDREAIVNRVTLGDQTPAYAFVPPGFDDFPRRRLVAHDPEAARRLLAEAGFPEGHGFPRKFLLFNTLEDHRKIAEAVVSMWNRELGIDFQLENKEWRVYLEAQSQLDFDLSRAGWIGDYMDPITFLELWTSDNGNNNTGWSNERYDELIRKAFRSETQEEHYAALIEAEEILMEAMPVIPVYHYNRIYLIRPEVRGWNPKLLDNRPYKYLYLE
ncbi:MAG: peptide ABC transporter substrate-binding protein [Opitutales bacterium]|nr:peptide ABC transporter substrate-binding protein [Opitutales bacterium]